MASKEKRAIKNLDTENTNQENEKKNEKEQHANKGEPLTLLPLEAGDYSVPRGNCRQFRVRQHILHHRWCSPKKPSWFIGLYNTRSVQAGGDRDPWGRGSNKQRLQEDPDKQKKRNPNMEKLYNDNEGKLESQGKPEGEVEAEDDGSSDEQERLEVGRKPGHAGEIQDEGQPDDEGQPEDEGKQEKQGEAGDEGEPRREAKLASEPRATEKCPAEDYVPRKAKRKTDRGTDDSPKDSQEDFQERHLG
ncbi:hypothetical protein MC885_019077, partial [Smutsia gigantea]